jgi:hypothetical protein
MQQHHAGCGGLKMTLYCLAGGETKVHQQIRNINSKFQKSAVGTTTK